MGEVIALELPAYRVHREVPLNFEDIELAKTEVRKLLRKAPYAMGAPAPKGSLTLRLPGMSIRLTLSVYSHGAFSTGFALSVTQAMSELRDTTIPAFASDMIERLLDMLVERKYFLTQVFKNNNCHDIEKDYYSVSFSPTWDSPGYEAIWFGIIVPKECP